VILLAALVCFGASQVAAAKKPAEADRPIASSDATDSPPSFDAAEIAGKLMRQLQDGLQSRNSRQLLAAFDGDRMPGYLAFKDEVESFFARHDSFRVYLRIESATVEQDSARAVVLATLEAVPRDGSPVIRRETELSFEFARTKGGWKIVELDPRSFFS
jgi:hypothetical protein